MNDRNGCWLNPKNYYEATRPEIDPYDRSYILYNIGLIQHKQRRAYKGFGILFRALERNHSTTVL
ncbi:hypothetical protein C4D60_Mb00t18330 [Musa balbisiana]|uniref:Uncharacterized protein n=1 Tax=Musa balbisiana TaxID=52838 RepID=A0A4S8I5Q6_MUSBA|nr:hypothetical protein C4D60_Mb00t18330 [Musa balbisiana]